MIEGRAVLTMSRRGRSTLLWPPLSWWSLEWELESHSRSGKQALTFATSLEVVWSSSWTKFRGRQIWETTLDTSLCVTVNYQSKQEINQKMSPLRNWIVGNSKWEDRLTLHGVYTDSLISLSYELYTCDKESRWLSWRKWRSSNIRTLTIIRKWIVFVSRVYTELQPDINASEKKYRKQKGTRR